MRLILSVIALYLVLLSPYFVVVTSESMEPTLKVGDLVFLSHRDPTVGDVIVYRHGDILIIHRLISQDGDRLITKGDNPNTNPEPDPRTVYKSDVVGVAVARVPYVGYIVIFLKDYPITFILLLLIAVFYDRLLPEVRIERKYKNAFRIALVILIFLLRLHPRTPEKAYLINRDSYFLGDGYYVGVTFYASGNTNVIIKVITLSGEYTFVRHYVYPGTSGVRNTGLYVSDKPIEVEVWKARSRSGGRNTSRRA